MEPSSAPLAGADDSLGAGLYAALRGPGNLVFSPASIATALRMALLGARGDTAAQLAAVLHLAGPQDAAPGLRARSSSSANSTLRVSWSGTRFSSPSCSGDGFMARPAGK